MKAKDLDKKFDSGEDITEFLDVKNATRSGKEQKRVNVDFPVWMIQRIFCVNIVQLCNCFAKKRSAGSC